MCRAQGPFAQTSGNVGLAFLLCMIPLCGAAGMAIDFARASNLQRQLQGAVDAAVLAAGAQGGGDETALKTTVDLYMNTNLSERTRASLGAVRVTFRKPATVRVEAEGTSQNALLGVIGLKQTKVAVASEVMRANPLELAVVLDNTNSMDGSRMRALQKAAGELVDTIMVEDADVRIGVVPFSQYVNVGLNNRDAPWLSTNDLRPNVRWDGCVGSRHYPLDVNDSSPNVPYPIVAQQIGVSWQYCPTPLTPLTNSSATIKAALQAMQLSGQTYAPAGLLWGWNVLSRTSPFTEGRPDGDPRVRKAMVFMTDGKNNRAPTYPSQDEMINIAPAAKLMSEVCTNIKKAGIHLYTVAFALDDAPAIRELRDCASDSRSAFTADNGSELVEAFAEITARLETLRLTR